MKKAEVFDSIFPKRIVNYATVWERFGAFVIDLLIIMLFVVFLSPKIPLGYCWILSAWIYEAVQISGYYHATIGQRTMGIKVANRQGGSLDFIEASLRHFSKYISLFTVLSGYLIIILDKRHQCLHDKIAESFVVTEESYQTAV